MQQQTARQLGMGNHMHTSHELTQVCARAVMAIFSSHAPAYSIWHTHSCKLCSVMWQLGMATTCTRATS